MTEFDPSHRTFVSYIDKSREYYLARGYGNPYRWAHHQDAPFVPLARPLSQSRVALVSTASLTRESARLMEVYSAPTAPVPVALYTDHRSWDKRATHTRDTESFLPLRRVAECAAAGRIRDSSSRFYGVPTDFSHRRTVEAYAPAVLDLCRADEIDVALLIPL